MNKLAIQKKKRRVINLCLVGLCILILAGFVLVDQIQNRKTTVTMTPEMAQAELDVLLESLPTAVDLIYSSPALCPCVSLMSFRLFRSQIDIPNGAILSLSISF